MDPGPVWREHDTENRTGYIENRYVMGYLEMWDTIIETFPEIWIDSWHQVEEEMIWKQ